MPKAYIIERSAFLFSAAENISCVYGEGDLDLKEHTGMGSRLNSLALFIPDSLSVEGLTNLAGGEKLNGRTVRELVSLNECSIALAVAVSYSSCKICLLTDICRTPRDTPTIPPFSVSLNPFPTVNTARDSL